MNFFALDYAQGTAYFGEQPLPLSDHYLRTLGRVESSNVKLGIRPEFIEVCPSAESDTVAVKKEHLQDLGTYAILTFSLNQQTFKARLPEDHPPLGETVYIRFPDDKLSLYVDEYRVEVDHE